MTTSRDKRFSGARLRVARHLRAKTLTQVGEAVAASPQYMHKLEATLTLCPSETMLQALADALGFNPGFFLTPTVTDFREEDFHFRRRASASLAVRNHAMAHGALFSELVAFLDRHLSLPVVDIPKRQATSREDIEQAAERCRQQWGLLLDAPILNLTRALERAGVVLACFHSLSPKLDAFSWPNDRPIIVASTAKACPSRSRFDIAHECGHLVLHDGLVTGDPETEDQANYFAGALLLPRTGFVREYPRHSPLDWISLFRLKARWGASVSAIIRRAYNLRLIDAATYRRGCIQIRSKGWDVREPHEPEQEAPEIVPMAFRLLFEQGFTYQSIADALGWREEVLELVSGVTPPPPTPEESADVISLQAARATRHLRRV